MSNTMEYAVSPDFLSFVRAAEPLDLALLRHELKDEPKDRQFLEAVENEIRRRFEVARDARAIEPDEAHAVSATG